MDLKSRKPLPPILPAATAQSMINALMDRIVHDRPALDRVFRSMSAAVKRAHPGSSLLDLDLSVTAKLNAAFPESADLHAGGVVGNDEDIKYAIFVLLWLNELRQFCHLYQSLRTAAADPNLRSQAMTAYAVKAAVEKESDVKTAVGAFGDTAGSKTPSTIAGTGNPAKSKDVVDSVTSAMVRAYVCFRIVMPHIPTESETGMKLRVESILQGSTILGKAYVALEADAAADAFGTKDAPMRDALLVHAETTVPLRGNTVPCVALVDTAYNKLVAYIKLHFTTSTGEEKTFTACSPGNSVLVHFGTEAIHDAAVGNYIMQLLSRYGDIEDVELKCGLRKLRHMVV